MEERRNKSRYVKNKFSPKTYISLVVFTLILVTVIYTKYYLTFSMYETSDYVKLLATIFIVGIVSYYLSFRFHRNMVSVVGISLIPVLLYDAMSMWRFEEQLKKLNMIGIGIMLVVSALAAGFISRKIRSSRKKNRYIIEKTAAFTRIGSCFLLIASVYIGKMHIQEQYSLWYSQILYDISDSNGEVDDYENSLEANIEEISKLDPERGWRNLELEEKAHVLECCIRVDTRYFGIEEAPALKIAYLEENLLGQYDPEEHVITLSYQYLTVSDGYSTLRTLCHEMTHAYQHSLVNLLQDLRSSEKTQKYENLLILYDAGEYEENIAHYVSDVTDDYSYLRYANQKVEVDAEKMADSLVLEYYQGIQKYLKKGSAA